MRIAALPLSESRHGFPAGNGNRKIPGSDRGADSHRHPHADRKFVQHFRGRRLAKQPLAFCCVIEGAVYLRLGHPHELQSGACPFLGSSGRRILLGAAAAVRQSGRGIPHGRVRGPDATFAKPCELPRQQQPHQLRRNGERWRLFPASRQDCGFQGWLPTGPATTGHRCNSGTSGVRSPHTSPVERTSDTPSLA